MSIGTGTLIGTRTGEMINEYTGLNMDNKTKRIRQNDDCGWKRTRVGRGGNIRDS